MNKNEQPEQLEAEKVEAALNAGIQGNLPNPSAGQSSDEIEMANNLLELAASAEPTGDFVHALGDRLALAAEEREVQAGTKNAASWKSGYLSIRKPPRFIRLTLGAAGLLLLVLLAYLGLPLLNRSELPQLPALSASAQGAAGENSSFAGAEFILQTGLPVVPEVLPVFSQLAPAEVSLPEVRSLADNLDVSGPIYKEQRPDTAGLPEMPKLYNVFNSARRVEITNLGFAYTDSSIPETIWSVPPLPFDLVKEIAMSYLQSRELLDFAYRAVVDPNSLYAINFEQTAGGWPVLNRGLSVTVTADGRVANISCQVASLDKIGNYPIHSAVEAWDDLQSGSLPGRWMQMSMTYPPDPNFRGPLEIWGPDIHMVAFAEVTGSVAVFLPVDDDGAQPLLKLGPDGPRLIVSAQDTQALIKTNYRPVLLWGQVRQDEAGELVMDVAGWKKVSELQTRTVQGTLIRRGGDVLLRQSDGKTYLLELVPASVPDGEEVSVIGWDTQRSQDGYPVLGWMSMETPPQPAPGSAATPEAAVTALALDATPALPGAVNVEKITEAPVTIATSVTGAVSSLSGKAYVDKVELVYVVSPLEDQQGETGAQIVQPAWRFSGHTPGGAKFEITFQAVLAQYIK